MKTKRLIIGMFSVLMCVAILAFAACKQNTTPETPSETEDVSITLVSEASVAEFETLKLVPVVKGEGTVLWKTSDGNVATVSDDGEVYGVKAGKAEITAYIGEKTAVCKVTVTPTVYAHELVLSSETVTMTKGKSNTVKASLKFNGVSFGAEGVTCEWTALGDGDKIASVETSDNGFTATFTGIAAGEAEFEASAVVRGYDVAARVTVRVIESVTVLNIANEKFVSGEGAYNLALTLGNETTDRMEIGAVQVIEDGQQKDNAEVVWVSDNENIAKEENGVIYALSAGKTRLEGSAEYNGKTLKIYVDVTVSKGNYNLQNVNINVQTAVDDYITIPEEITASSVQKITLSGSVVFDGTTTIDGSKAEIIAGSMPYGSKNLGENKEVTVETDEGIFSFTASVYTMIVSDKDDFDRWQEVAAREAVKEGLCTEDKLGQFTSGYFVLGADIEYNGGYAPDYTFMHYGNLYNWGSEWGDGSSFGFTGTFDGKGYSVKGLSITGRYDAFVTTLAGGVIKNISFTDTEIGGGASVVARAGFGTIENVFIEFSRIFAYSDDNASAIFGSYDYTSRTVKNVVIDLSYCTFEDGVKNVFVVGGSYGTITNVFVIGEFEESEENNVKLFDAQPAEGSFYAHCDFARELFDDEEIFSALEEFDTSFWKVTENIVLPVSVYEENNVTPEITNEENTVEQGAFVTVKTNAGYVTVALKEEVAGVTFEGKTLSVDKSVATGTQITVVVTSVINGETSEYVFTVAAASYVLGTPVDMSEMNAATEINLSGISSMWNRGFEEASAAPEGASGMVFKANGGGQYHGFMLALNEGISLKSGMNYIAVRMYISDASLTSVNLRFYNTSRASHEEGVDADMVVATNQWTTVYIEASKFVADGKITGFKCANFQADSANAVFYVDSVKIVKVAGTEIDLNGTQIGYIGLGNYWHNGEIVSGSEIVLDGGAAYYNANIIFATPFTVTSETKIYLSIKVSQAMNDGFLAFFNGKGEHKASYTDVATADAPVNDYVTVTLNLSDFAEDGQLKNISIGVWGNVTGTLTLYIETIAIA